MIIYHKCRKSCTITVAFTETRKLSWSDLTDLRSVYVPAKVFYAVENGYIFRNIITYYNKCSLKNY